MLTEIYAKLLFNAFTFLIKSSYKPSTTTSFETNKHSKMIRLSHLAEDLFNALTFPISKNERYSFTMPVRYDNSTIIIRPLIFSEIIMVSGTWEPYVKSILEKDIEKNDVVVDVGANIGIYAIPLAKRVNKVVAIEPHPKSSEMLEKSIKLNNLDNITLVKKAISDSKGKVFFSLSNRPMESGITVSNKTENTIEIESIDLDTVLANEMKIDWLIIDVEGLELKVLDGAQNILRNFSPNIIVEVQDYNKVNEILKKEGYIMTHLSYKYYYAQKKVKS